MISGRMVCDRHDSYISPEMADRRTTRTIKERPLKNARPFNPRDTYEVAEWAIFNFLSDNYRNEAVDFTSDGGPRTVAATSVARGPGFTGICLYDLIAEDKRPRRMITLAKAKLKEIADYLLTVQFAGPHRTNGVTDADARWGGFSDDGSLTGSISTWTTQDCAAAGLALLRAYQVHGTAAYLGAARAALWYLRGVQCGGRLTSLWTSTGIFGAGSRYNSGTWARSNVFSGGTPAPDHKFSPGTLLALEFYEAFRVAVGDETIGSSTTGGSYASSRAALLSAAIAEAKAFWLTTGVIDSVQAVVIRGLSSTTPYDYFWAYSSLGEAGQTGSWMYADGATQVAGTLIDSLGWAMGIRALHKVDGASAAVTALFDWLMTFTSRAAFELPAAYTDATMLAAAKGTYNPKTALSTSLLVRAGGGNVTVNGTSFYSLATAGAMGALYSSRQAAAFKDLKDALGVPRRRGAQGGPTHMLGPMGICGLNLQPRSSATQRRYNVREAALTGLIYRHAPQAWTGRGHA
jgi:hypothetical protein